MLAIEEKKAFAGTVGLPVPLLEEIDKLVGAGVLGFRSRAELVAEATRAYLRDLHRMSPQEGRKESSREWSQGQVARRPFPCLRRARRRPARVSLSFFFAIQPGTIVCYLNHDFHEATTPQD